MCPPQPSLKVCVLAQALNLAQVNWYDVGVVAIKVKLAVAVAGARALAGPPGFQISRRAAPRVVEDTASVAVLVLADDVPGGLVRSSCKIAFISADCHACKSLVGVSSCSFRHG